MQTSYTNRHVVSIFCCRMFHPPPQRDVKCQWIWCLLLAGGKIRMYGGMTPKKSKLLDAIGYCGGCELLQLLTEEDGWFLGGTMRRPDFFNCTYPKLVLYWWWNITRPKLDWPGWRIDLWRMGYYTSQQCPWWQHLTCTVLIDEAG